MEIVSIAMLVVLAVFFCWDVSERLHSGIVVLLNRPEGLPGTQLPGYLAGTAIAITLLSLGVFGVFEKNVWLYTVASISYLFGGFGESLGHSRAKTVISDREDKDNDASQAAQENNERARLFFLRLTYRYILPIALGYLWFVIQPPQ